MPTALTRRVLKLVSSLGSLLRKEVLFVTVRCHLCLGLRSGEVFFLLRKLDVKACTKFRVHLRAFVNSVMKFCIRKGWEDLMTISVTHEGVWRSGGTAPSFLKSELDADEWSASRPARFDLGRRVPFAR